MNRIARALPVLALSALLGGCASAPDLFEGAKRPIRIDVRNLNFSDASVWAVYRAERIRLGTVTGKTDGSFQVPWKGAEPVHMEFDLVGAGRCATEELTVDEGDVLYLEIALELSSMRGCVTG